MSSSNQSKYPENNPFLLKQNNTNYTYTIIKEGFYPSKNIICYTSARSRNGTQFKIPNKYLVQTSWGRGNLRHTIKCEIEYELDGQPVFRIWFEKNFQQYVVESKESPTKAANEYLRSKNPNTHANLSGIHVFGLNATDVEKEREKKNHSHSFKPFNMLSESMKTKRSRSFSIHMDTIFQNETLNFYNSSNQPVLQEIRFNVQNKNYLANYCDKNEEKENQPALQPELPRDRVILNARKRINEEMSQKIPISILNIKHTPLASTINEAPDIEDQEIVEEVLQYIGKAGYRHISDILLFVIPDLVNRNILNPNDPIIHVQISGDGRNVGRKVKHVMVTCTILDDILNIHKADFHYTTILYPGVENYETLQNVMEPMISELHNLVINGLIDPNGTKWKIEPYFSSDWKFMAIILGFNAANANYFCPWCMCTKKDIGNRDKIHKIEKNMNQIQSSKPPPGHLKAPLLPMIPLDHYVPDELHVMLRIWDRMWALVIQELKSENRFDDNIRRIISVEMQRISEPETDSALFAIQAKKWLDLFLTPYQGEPNTISFKKGLYRPKDITPYMHVLINHIPEFIKLHGHFGLAAFSCAGVEKKNHDQVSAFFRKTMKDGGKGIERKSAIFEILYYENQFMYFTQQSTFDSVLKPQYFQI
ncbi:hypothetical protein GLOIN_2v1778530 [Rhizophagus irregularis DAOM 181602=DAOM 197198]|nr:hypothetical protein GLOIN_2v1778530 [Rhizophagus irregularis DAOM 181602=DAOM 197198]